MKKLAKIYYQIFFKMEDCIKLPPFEVEEVNDVFNLDNSQLLDWGLLQNKIPEAWKISKGEGINVMVIDTGKPKHEDIKEGLPGMDKNFVKNEDVFDSNGHHTHCAGIILAENNNKGSVGVAPKANLISVKVLDKNGRGSTLNLISSLEYALEVKPDIISMSLGSFVPHPKMRELVKKLYEQNIPIVCAAGNSGERGVNYPAAYEETISIAAHDKNGNIASFSSKGPEVDWAAPGVNIYSTYLNNKYARLSGTSMACPFAVGLIALMLSKHRKLEKEGKPNDCKTVEQIKSHLLRFSVDKGQEGKDKSWGFGIIDILKLLKSLSPKPKPDKPKPKPETPEEEKPKWFNKKITWIISASFLIIAIILSFLSYCNNNEELPSAPFIREDGTVDWDKKFELE